MASIKVYRFTVPDQANTLTVPDIGRKAQSKHVVMKNVGLLNSIRINFDGDSTNYWTLSPGQETPVLFGINGGDLLYTDGVGGAGTLEVMIWE